MPLESGTYLPDLVASNPAHTDGMNQGDGHIRLIKSVLLNTFKNWTDTSGTGGVGYLSATQAQLDTVASWATGSQALFPAGSVSAPSIGFTGDADSGWYKAAEDNIALSLNGIQQVSYTTTAATFAQPVTAPNYNNGSFVPPGCILMYSGAAAPTGWAFCNGGTVLASANPVLNSIYGNSGGTITLPDMRDMVPVGQGTMGGATDRGLITLSGINTLGSNIGTATHTLSTSEMPAHQHSVFIRDPGHVHSGVVNGDQSVCQGGGVIGTFTNPFASTNSSTTGITVGQNGPNYNDNLTTSVGSGSSFGIVQPSFIVGFIIKLG